jgi:alanyl-tRNA synthetase
MCNARYHTAGHLIGTVGEMMYPAMRAVKGHSFPGEAYVEFALDNPLSSQIIESSQLESSLNQIIVENHILSVFDIDPLCFEEKFYKLSYSIPKDKKFRAVQIGHLPPVPCGGTHVASLAELGRISITKIKTKSAVTRISSEVI